MVAEGRKDEAMGCQNRLTLAPGRCRLLRNSHFSVLGFPGSETSADFSAPPVQPFSPPRPLPHCLPFAVESPGSTAGLHTEFTRNVTLPLVPPLHTEFTRNAMTLWDPSATASPFDNRPFRPPPFKSYPV